MCDRCSSEMRLVIYIADGAHPPAGSSGIGDFILSLVALNLFSAWTPVIMVVCSHPFSITTHRCAFVRFIPSFSSTVVLMSPHGMFQLWDAEAQLPSGQFEQVWLAERAAMVQCADETV